MEKVSRQGLDKNIRGYTSRLERVILRAGAMLIFSVLFQFQLMYPKVLTPLPRTLLIPSIEHSTLIMGLHYLQTIIIVVVTTAMPPEPHTLSLLTQLLLSLHGLSLLVCAHDRQSLLSTLSHYLPSEQPQQPYPLIMIVLLSLSMVVGGIVRECRGLGVIALAITGVCVWERMGELVGYALVVGLLLADKGTIHEHGSHGNHGMVVVGMQQQGWYPTEEIEQGQQGQWLQSQQAEIGRLKQVVRMDSNRVRELEQRIERDIEERGLGGVEEFGGKWMGVKLRSMISIRVEEPRGEGEDKGEKGSEEEKKIEGSAQTSKTDLFRKVS